MAKADLPILRLWPGGDFSCDTTLQACVSGANPGDGIRIDTDGPIDESIAFSKSLAFTAQAGFHPVFSPGRSITATTASTGAYSIRIEGLTLAQGTISVTQNSTSPLSVDVVSNTVSNESSSPSSQAIELNSVAGAGPVAFEVSGNTVTIDGSADAIFLLLSSGSHGSIDNNSIAMGSNQGGTGILVKGQLGAGPSSADVVANRISGTAYVDGINIFGRVAVRLFDNLIVGQASIGVSRGGVVLQPVLGDIDATVVR